MKNYLPFDKCLGVFSKKYLFRHIKKCTGSNIDKPKSNRNIQSRCAMLLPSTVSVEDSFAKNVLSKMVNDDVYNVIRNDTLIMAYGQHLYKKHGHEKHLHQYVSQKLREIGRFLLCAKEVNPSVANLTCLMDKNNIQHVYPACRN